MTSKKAIGVFAFLAALIRLAGAEHWPVWADILLIVGATISIGFYFVLRHKESKDPVIASAEQPAQKVIGWPTILMLAGVALGLTFMSCQFLFVISRTMYLEHAEQQWHTTNATVVDSALRTSQDKNGKVSWSPFWTYTYSVGGTTYKSQSIDIPGGYSANWYPNQAEADNDADTRAIGQHIVAYYDPDDPRRSVLDRRLGGGVDWLVISMCGLMFAVALFIGRLTMTAWKRKLAVEHAPATAAA